MLAGPDIVFILFLKGFVVDPWYSIILHHCRMRNNILKCAYGAHPCLAVLLTFLLHALTVNTVGPFCDKDRGTAECSVGNAFDGTFA